MRSVATSTGLMWDVLRNDIVRPSCNMSSIGNNESEHVIPIAENGKTQCAKLRMKSGEPGCRKSETDNSDLDYERNLDVNTEPRLKKSSAGNMNSIQVMPKTKEGLSRHVRRCKDSKSPRCTRSNTNMVSLAHAMLVAKIVEPVQMKLLEGDAEPSSTTSSTGNERLKHVCLKKKKGNPERIAACSDIMKPG